MNINNLVLANTSPRAIKNRYNKWAKTYERDLVSIMSYTAPRTVAKKFLPYLKKGQSILELGCGTGLNSLPYYYLKDCRISGIDISKKCLDEAIKKKTYKALYLGDIEKVMSSLEEKRLTFDAVLCVGVFEYFKKLDSVLKRMKRVVKKNGYVTFTIPSTAARGLCGHTLSKTKKQLNENKLRLLETFRFKAYLSDEKPIFNYGIICKPIQKITKDEDF